MTITLGDCRGVMAEMPAESVDAIVTDPPYGLEFMGKVWDRIGDIGARETARKPPVRQGDDFAGRMSAVPAFNDSPNRRCGECGHWEYSGTPCRCDSPDFPNTKRAQAQGMQEWHATWAVEAYRILKPGGHLAAFGGSRTYHRLAVAIEDAGFEIRDSLMWLYGTGFPKSLNLDGGLGTALKPAYEPIVLARKPLSGTVAQTVTEHGTGALNIDAARIGPADTRRTKAGGVNDFPHEDDAWHPRSVDVGSEDRRWPANVLLDPEAAALLDEQAPNAGAGGQATGQTRAGESTSASRNRFAGTADAAPYYADRGGASRFFYTAKASRAEREAGLAGLPAQRRIDSETRDDEAAGSNNPRLRTGERRNHHPTVKPVSLMRWLVRLVTPPGGTVLDPFLGSGTTGMACVAEGFEFLGIEMDPDYVEIAEARIQRVRDEPEAFAVQGELI